MASPKRIYSGSDAISAERLKTYSTTFSAVGFAGTVVGQLAFGYIADRVGRKSGMIMCTLIVFVSARPFPPLSTSELTDCLFRSSTLSLPAHIPEARSLACSMPSPLTGSSHWPQCFSTCLC